MPYQHLWDVIGVQFIQFLQHTIEFSRGDLHLQSPLWFGFDLSLPAVDGTDRLVLDASRAGLDHSLSEVADFSLNPSPRQGCLNDVNL